MTEEENMELCIQALYRAFEEFEKDDMHNVKLNGDIAHICKVLQEYGKCPLMKDNIKIDERF